MLLSRDKWGVRSTDRWFALTWGRMTTLSRLPCACPTTDRKPDERDHRVRAHPDGTEKGGGLRDSFGIGRSDLRTGETILLLEMREVKDLEEIKIYCISCIETMLGDGGMKVYE